MEINESQKFSITVSHDKVRSNYEYQHTEISTVSINVENIDFFGSFRMYLSINVIYVVFSSEMNELHYYNYEDRKLKFSVPKFILKKKEKISIMKRVSIQKFKITITHPLIAHILKIQNCFQIIILISRC